MKKIFIALGLTVFTTTSFACQLSIPESYVPIFLNPPVSGHYQKCEEKPKEPCHCVDNINSWYAELVDNEVLDYVAWRQIESCADELDCDEKFSRISCTEGVEVKNYETLSVYCAVDIMKIEGKKLAHNDVKKSSYEGAILEVKNAEIVKDLEDKAIVEELRAIKKTDISTNAKMGDVLMKIIKRLEKVK